MRLTLPNLAGTRGSLAWSLGARMFAPENPKNGLLTQSLAKQGCLKLFWVKGWSFEIVGIFGLKVNWDMYHHVQFENRWKESHTSPEHRILMHAA